MQITNMGSPLNVGGREKRERDRGLKQACGRYYFLQGHCSVTGGSVLYQLNLKSKEGSIKMGWCFIAEDNHLKAGETER